MLPITYKDIDMALEDIQRMQMVQGVAQSPQTMDDMQVMRRGGQGLQGAPMNAQAPIPQFVPDEVMSMDVKQNLNEMLTATLPDGDSIAAKSLEKLLKNNKLLESMLEETRDITQAASGGGLMQLAARQEGGGVWKETPDGLREMFKRDDGNWYTKGGVNQRGLYNSKYDVDKEDPIIDKPGPTAPPLPQQLKQKLPSMPIAPSPWTALPGAATRQPVTLVLDEEEDYRKRQEQTEFNDLLRRTITSRQKDDVPPASPAYPPTYSDLSPGALGGKLPLPDSIRVIQTPQQEAAQQQALRDAAYNRAVKREIAFGAGKDETYSDVPGGIGTGPGWGGLTGEEVGFGGAFFKHGGGLQGLAAGGEFHGRVPGDGHGMEDNVYMPIKEGEKQVATLAVSPTEYVVDSYTMAALGNGNPNEGADVMDEVVESIREKAYGTDQQPNQIDGLSALRPMIERV